MTTPEHEDDPALSRLKNLPNGRLFQHSSQDYVWKGLTADGLVQIMGNDGRLHHVPDPETGFPRCPNAWEFIDLLATRDFVMKSAPLADPVRAKARRRQMTAEEVADLKKDKAAIFRMIVIRKADQDLPSTGDVGLRKWRNLNWSEDKVRAQYGCWPAGSTIRSWINARGRWRDRRWSDATSERGKARTRRLDKSSLALALLHAEDTYKLHSGVIFAAYTLYHRDLRRLCAGDKIFHEEGANIPRPATIQNPMSYETFRQIVRRIKIPENTERKRGSRGRRKEYGGGGEAPEAFRPFEHVQLDDMQFPAWGLVDPGFGVVAGIPTVTIGVCLYTGTIAGFDVDFDPASSSTMMRTILSCATPKVPPLRYRDRYPGLAAIGGKVGTYQFDNALENTARSIEDMAGDTCSEIQWAGEDRPMDKQLVERTIQTLQSFVAKELESYTIDVKTRRELNLDPSVKAIATLETFRTIIWDAICTIHVTCNQNKDGMVPLARFELATKDDPIDMVADLDDFAMSICDVEYDVTLDRNGLHVFDGLQHSEHQLTPNLYAEEVSFRNGRTMRGGGIKVKVKYRADNILFVYMWSDFRGEYVAVKCTRPLYAAGLSKWMHERIREFAKAKALGFNTEEERIDARAGLVELCRLVAGKATDAERRLTQRILSSAVPRAVVGDGVVDLIYVPASPTGQEVRLTHDLTASTRKDRHIIPPRRQRGSEKNNIGRQQADEQLVPTLISSTPIFTPPVKPRIVRAPASPTGREQSKGTNGQGRPAAEDPGGKTPKAGSPTPATKTKKPKGPRAGNSTRPNWNHYE